MKEIFDILLDKSSVFRLYTKLISSFFSLSGTATQSGPWPTHSWDF